MDTPIRKKLRRIETARQWRFVTFSCFRRLPLLDNATARDLVVQAIAKAQERSGIGILAWVIMPEHVHMILATPGGAWTIPKVLAAIKQPVAQVIIKEWRRTNAPILHEVQRADGGARFWQAGGGFDRNVRNDEELVREVDYIHHNPVKRGLVATPTDWKWSSARWYAGEPSGPIVIVSSPCH